MLVLKILLIACKFFKELTIITKTLKGLNLPNNDGHNDTNIPLFINDNSETYEVQPQTAKQFYTLMIGKISQSPTCLDCWNSNGPSILTHETFKEACVNKIYCIKEKKLAATNFTILHNVLPCNFNLFRWRLW